MLIHSLSFLLFLVLVVGVYFLTSHKYRWAVLLGASLYFYASFKLEYVFILLGSILLTYMLGLLLDRAHAPLTRKRLLIGGIGAQVLILLLFKYLSFVSDSVNAFIPLIGISYSWTMTAILFPLGISFFTFQSIGYLVDVYRKKTVPERHFGIFAVFVSFFPKIVSGPIERSTEFLQQLHVEHKPDMVRMFNASLLILWGLFKKVVIADRLALIVNPLFSSTDQLNSFTLLFTIFCFGYQLYCDFSGYVDIARGSAGLFGLTLAQNFNRPFFSKNPSEFWRRWHISLSRWFQDYVFTPLYLRIQKTKFIAPLSSSKKHFISFACSLVIGELLLGLWHGPSWTYVFFGAYYAMMILVYYLTRSIWDNSARILQHIVTFVIISIGWILFRSTTITQAGEIMRGIISFSGNLAQLSTLHLPIAREGFIVILLCLICMEWAEFKFPELQAGIFISADHTRERAFKLLFAILVWIAILLFVVRTQIPFIYAQF